MDTLIYHLIHVFEALWHRITDFVWHHYSRGYCRIHGIVLGDGVRFNGRCKWQVQRGATVRLGDRFICSSGHRHCIGAPGRSKFEVTEGATLTVGADSGMSNTSIHCHESVSIGSHVNIGAGVMIFDTNFHSTDWQVRADRSRDTHEARTAPVRIGDHVFIGAGCIVTKGVCIGDRSMVAAGSVVVCDIPADEIWGGNPAHRIKGAPPADDTTSAKKSQIHESI